MYRYSDTDITFSECDESVLLAENELYLPDLSILSEKSFGVGKHNESKENVYFTVTGIFDYGVSFREIRMTIILKTEYQSDIEAGNLSLGSPFVVSGITVSYALTESEFPFCFYFAAFTVNNIRYYFNYMTIEEGDIQAFLPSF